MTNICKDIGSYGEIIESGLSQNLTRNERSDNEN